MAVTYGFYNALNHDRLYDAIQMSSIFDGIIRDGIFSTIGDTMIVTAPEDGMYVNVGSGRAWFNHTWTLNDTAYPIEAEQAEVVLDRIDAVILEVNSSAEVRANSIKFLKGTPSSNPVKPTLTHNAEVNQYALAYVRIRAGQTTIFQSDIENAIGTDETPFITGALQQVSIETLLKQWEAEFNTYFTNFKNTSTTEFNNWFAAKISEYTAWFAQMQTDMDSNFNEFDAWFQNIKDQLDQNQAGHLQLQIDALNSDINTLEAEMPFAGGSKVNINFEYDVVPNMQYSNEHYKLTVGDTVRENNFSSSKLHFDEYGILTVGDGVLEVTYDVTDSRTGKITHESYTYTINMPYFGRFAYNVTISADLCSYQGWLESIGKDASSYSTIEDVFADEKLLRELMTRHASVDYLVEWLANNNEDAHTVLNNDYCAKWINLRDYALDMLYANPTVKAVMDEVDKYGYGEWVLIDGTWQPKGNIPIMTSNTAPYGECITSSLYSTYYTYNCMSVHAFDEQTTSACNGGVGQWIGYKFTNPIKISRVKFKFTNGGTSKLQISNDGTNYTDVIEFSGSESEVVEKDVNIDTYAMYMRVLCITLVNGTHFGSRGIQVYGRQLNVSVPKMTSNTAPWGEVKASSVYSGRQAYYAFNGSTPNYATAETTFWYTENAGEQWIQYDFKRLVRIKKYIFNINTGDENQTVQLVGSKDGVAWFDLENEKHTVNVISTSGRNYAFDIGVENEARYIRIKVTHISGVAIGAIQFYGLDYSEREFEEGSTMKYIYDHGVEFNGYIKTIVSDGCYVNKNNDYIELYKTGEKRGATAYLDTKINFSNYNIMRCIVGLKAYSNTSSSSSDKDCSMLHVQSTPANINSGYVAGADIKYSTMPNNSYLDVSSVNGENYAVINDYTDGNHIRYCDITEWWLE